MSKHLISTIIEIHFIKFLIWKTSSEQNEMLNEVLFVLIFEYFEV